MKLNGAFRDPWVWAQFVLFGAVVVGLPMLGRGAPNGGALDWLRWSAGSRWPAAVPVAAGILFAIAGVRALGRNLTPATTPVRDGTLVMAGIYRWVRHPIYTGVIFGLWGIAWAANGWRAGLATLAVAYLFFDRKSAVEEAKLVRVFPEYPAYRHRVPKLLPWRGPL